MRRKTPKAKRSQLIKTLDSLWSRYVRQKYADSFGNVTCYTCDYTANWKKMQNGHYITRSAKCVRWDENNLRPQCFVCNMRRQGMSHIFREKLVQELGEEVVVDMEQRSKLLFKEKDEWLIERIEEMKARLEGQKP